MVIGDAKVGKSNVIRRWIEEQSSPGSKDIHEYGKYLDAA